MLSKNISKEICQVTKELWSKTNFSYFDANSDKRIDEHKQICDWLDKNLE